MDERAKFGAGELGAFDSLLGLYTPNIGLLKQVPGKSALQYIADSDGILAVHPTNDSRKNIIIQGRTNVYVMSEAELFGRVVPTNLTPVSAIEEEDMSQSIVAHIGVGGGGGGGATVANTWVTAPLNLIVSQFNPDGTAAANVTGIGAGVFTLATGWYRFKGWSMGADNTAGVRLISRLIINGGLPVWNGLLNENSDVVLTDVANHNKRMDFAGVYHCAVPTTFELQMKSTQNFATGLGRDDAAAGTFNTWRWIEILRTGP